MMTNERRGPSAGGAGSPKIRDIAAADSGNDPRVAPPTCQTQVPSSGGVQTHAQLLLRVVVAEAQVRRYGREFLAATAGLDQREVVENIAA
jgi:hypothetical protein